jgi:hypothetical protein
MEMSVVTLTGRRGRNQCITSYPHDNITTRLKSIEEAEG